MRTKLIKTNDHNWFERGINNFIEDKDIVDIKYQKFLTAKGMCYSALIIYKDEVITNNFSKSKNELIDEIIEDLEDNLGRYTECGKVHGGNCVSLADGSCSANLISGFFSEVKESIEKFKDETK